MGRISRNHRRLRDSREANSQTEGGVMAGKASEATIGSHPSSVVPRRPPLMGRIAEILAAHATVIKLESDGTYNRPVDPSLIR